MKLWMSAEIDADVVEKNREVRKSLTAKVNQRLGEKAFDGPWEEWAFIPIIMSDKDAFKEVSKKNKKDKSLEFRLKIDHGLFLKATQAEAERMVVDALRRSVDMMSELDVTAADVAALRAVLDDVVSDE